MGRAGLDEQLADDGPAGGGDLAGLLGADRHVAPAQELLALGADGPLEHRFQRPPFLLLGRQEAHHHAVAAGRRQGELAQPPQQLVGHLHQDPRPVARARIGARGAAVLEVLERRDGPRDDLVRRAVVEPRDHADAAGVVLETWVVETDGPWRLFAVRGHGSARKGWCSPWHGQAGT
jgi:hypothetical protein